MAIGLLDEAPRQLAPRVGSAATGSPIATHLRPCTPYIRETGTLLVEEDPLVPD
jgi:hypothetical protein